MWLGSLAASTTCIPETEAVGRFVFGVRTADSRHCQNFRKKKHERKNKTNFNGFCAVAWIYPASAAKLCIQFYLAAILFMIRRQIHGVNRLSIYYITVCGVRFGVQSKRSKLDYLIGCKHGTNGNEANRKLMRFDDHPSHPAQMSAPSSNEC